MLDICLSISFYFNEIIKESRKMLEPKTICEAE